MIKQLGNKLTIRAYLVLFLTAAGLLSGATNVYLAYHRMIVVEVFPHRSLMLPQRAEHL